jgi:fructokinase
MTSEPTNTANARCRVIGTGLVALDRIRTNDADYDIEELGGSCGNVLISLAMLGRPVTPVLRLGSDPVGARLERDLRLAGADTRLVVRERDVRSPVIVELIDTVSGAHSFAFTCAETSERLGTFEPITRKELAWAMPLLNACSIFYADRVSEAICDAMEAASAAGAIVHFEPSSRGDEGLFRRALAAADILKFSVDRLPAEAAASLEPGAFGVVTAGHLGLEVHHGGSIHRLPAPPAEEVRDTCGAGDMVTLGLLDAILQSGACHRTSLTLDTILAGVRSGQRLAAANCAYVGARGLFRERGAAHVRSMLVDA